jgi:hypothetical protein
VADQLHDHPTRIAKQMLFCLFKPREFMDKWGLSLVREEVALDAAMEQRPWLGAQAFKDQGFQYSHPPQVVQICEFWLVHLSGDRCRMIIIICLVYAAKQPELLAFLKPTLLCKYPF